MRHMLPLCTLQKAINLHAQNVMKLDGTAEKRRNLWGEQAADLTS